MSNHPKPTYYFQIGDPNDNDSPDWMTDSDFLLFMDGEKNFCAVIICPKEYWDAQKRLYDGHISVGAGGPLDLPEEFEELQEASFVYHGSAADARTHLLAIGATEHKMI